MFIGSIDRSRTAYYISRDKGMSHGQNGDKRPSCFVWKDNFITAVFFGRLSLANSLRTLPYDRAPAYLPHHNKSPSSTPATASVATVISVVTTEMGVYISSWSYSNICSNRTGNEALVCTILTTLPYTREPVVACSPNTNLIIIITILHLIKRLLCVKKKGHARKSELSGWLYVRNLIK